MLKKIIKKSNIITKLYRVILKYRNTILCKISPKLLIKIKYIESQHKKPDLKNPTNFNEKLIYLELNDYYKNDLVSKCTDKYAVREYIEEQGCKKILNKLYGVYTDARNIKWDELPQKFALKCTHGYAYNIICTDKEKLDKEATIKQLNKWLDEKFGYATGEIHYTRIIPRIICEQYLETSAGILPNDYKLYCFDGEPKLVLVCTEREKKLKLTFLDLEWNLMDIGVEENEIIEVPEKPSNFDEMIEYSKKLSKPFKFVRVDFYNCNGKVVFGELTFTPAGGFATYYNEKGNKLLGDMMQL